MTRPSLSELLICPTCGDYVHPSESTDDGLCVGCAIFKHGYVLSPCRDCGESVKVYDVEAINEGTVCCDGGCEG